MNIDIIDEIKSLHNHMIKRLFCCEKTNKNDRPKPLQISILTFLLKHKDEVIYQKDLERKFQISKAAISEVLNIMENNDLINKLPEENDARKKRIVLTTKAQEMYDEMLNYQKEINNSIIEGISTEELNTFIKIAEKLKENMKKEGKKC